MAISMVVFDMAGTTVDENNVVYKTLHKVINLSGINIDYDLVLFETAGKEKKEAINSIFIKYGNESDYNLDKVYSIFSTELENAYNYLEIKPQPFATEIFNFLRNKQIKIVLNTGYNLPTAEKILTKLNWSVGKQIDLLITASHVVKNRPEPDMIFQAMKVLGINNPAEVAKVGDSIIDIEEGKNANCSLNIAVLTGAQTRNQLTTANPDYIINHLGELFNIF